MKFVRNDTEEYIWVTDVPDKKKPVLIIGTGDEGEIVASFKSDTAADRFSQFLSKFLTGVTE